MTASDAMIANGTFAHRYHVKDRRKGQQQALYYTGEAALALVLAYQTLGDARYLATAEKHYRLAVRLEPRRHVVEVERPARPIRDSRVQPEFQ